MTTQTPSVAFDHLVIGADSLTQGKDWARQTLGVEPPEGGAHPAMGTHNLLARLPSGYLEVIAINRQAAAPSRARWYGLDTGETRTAIATKPKPIAWVLAVDDIQAAANRATWDVGEIINASRGDLNWRISVPTDGAVPLGVLPTLIEWPAALGKRAPTDRMADLGLALRSLRLKHPYPSRIEAALDSVGAGEAMAQAGVALHVENAAAALLEAMFTSTRLEMRI